MYKFRKLICVQAIPVYFFLLVVIWVFWSSQWTKSVERRGYWEKVIHISNSLIDLKFSRSADFEAKRKEIKLRHNHLLDVCANHEAKYQGRYDNIRFSEHLLYHDKANLLFCGAEKTGYTFWRRVFLTLNKPDRFQSPYSIPAPAAYQHVLSLGDFPQNASSIIANAHAAMFTRNPYERLYSAYMDKLFNANYYFMLSFGHRIIRDYRLGATQEEIDCGKNVTFPEFVKFYIDYEHGNHSKDNHFMTLTEHCRPCNIKYGFLGKMDDFVNEFAFFVQYFNLTRLSTNLTSFKWAYKMDAIEQALLDFKTLKSDFKDHKCFGPEFAWERQWQFMQARGFISDQFSAPAVHDFDNKTEKRTLFSTFFLKSSKEDRDLKTQKKKYMNHAYSLVSHEDKVELCRIFQTDCNIFGYDCQPP